MKKYIQPNIKVELIKLENCILAGSTGADIDPDNPGTEPALSKGLNFFDEEESDKSKGIWD